MYKIYKTLIVTIFFVSLLKAEALKLQNGENYSGCEDGYLSAIYTSTDLQEIKSDSLTNHFSEKEIYLSR